MIVADQESLTDEMIRRAEGLVPMIRERARAAEQRRCVHEETIKEVERVGLLQMLVPCKWGGMGLGLRALCEVSRVLAHGDDSTAWTIGFLIENNWMACTLSMEAQRQLYADRPFIRMAGPLTPDGRAYCFLMPIGDVTVHDEWFMAGMAATSSTAVSGKDVFVSAERGLPMDVFHTRKHPGAVHEESLYRYPILQSLFSMMAALIVGSAEAVVELGRERLPNSMPWGIARIKREASRARWGVTHQKARCARLIYNDLLGMTIRKGEAEEPWSLEDEGRLALDLLTIGTLCKETARMTLDGAGSSAFQLDHPLQRYLRDIDVMANHIAFDEDVVVERASRWALGLGRAPGDPFPPRHKPPPGQAGDPQ